MEGQLHQEMKLKTLGFWTRSRGARQSLNGETVHEEEDTLLVDAIAEYAQELEASRNLQSHGDS